MAKKPKSEDYELDGIRHLNLSEDDIKAHKRTRKIMHNLELAVIIGVPVIGAVTAVGYGIYKCLPEPVRETLQNLPSETYRVCSDICQYFSQFTS